MQRCPGAAGIIVAGRTKTPDGAVDGGSFHHVTILSDRVSAVKQPVTPAQHGRRDASVTCDASTPTDYTHSYSPVKRQNQKIENGARGWAEILIMQLFYQTVFSSSRTWVPPGADEKGWRENRQYGKEEILNAGLIRKRPGKSNIPIPKYCP